MSALNHHKLIVDFLICLRDNTSELSFIQFKPNADQLLNHILNLRHETKQQAHIAKELNIDKSKLHRKHHSQLNDALDELSAKHEISPSIQLYFNHQGSYIGGHFACCDVPKEANVSEHLINVHQLQAKLEAVKKKLLKVDSPKNSTRHHKHEHTHKHEGEIKVTVKFEGNEPQGNDDGENESFLPVWLGSDFNSKLSKLYRNDDLEKVNTALSLLSQKQFSEAHLILKSMAASNANIILLKQLAILLKQPIKKIHHKEAKRIFVTLFNIQDPEYKDVATHVLHIMKEKYYTKLGRKLPDEIPSLDSCSTYHNSEQMQFIASLFE